MPRYAYSCAGNHTFEQVAPFDASERPCPECGLPAQRAFCSGLPAIKGDTVPKVCGQSSAITKHGYIDVDQAFDAIDDVQRTARKQGVEPPDLFREARRRVAAGEATERRIAQ
jgi:putative FmdB family regulatory protein